MKPEHIPDHLIVEFDCLRPEGFEQDVHLSWYTVQRNFPFIFWTPLNGGHWVATRGKDIRRMQINNGLFSHAKYSIPFDALCPAAPPATSDAPFHAKYRQLILPGLQTEGVGALEPTIRLIARETIAALAPRGQCEFVDDFAQVLPIAVFLRLVDLPIEDKPYLLELAHKAARPENPDDHLAAFAGMHVYLANWIAARQRLPGADLISRIANGYIDDRPVSDEEALGICTTLLFGGLDTVASMMGFFACHLATHPAQRMRLSREPALIPKAVEEMIRRFGVVNTARAVTRDEDYEGVFFKRGDQILLPNPLFGLDERITPSPLEVDFDRPLGNRHVAFGRGAHLCPGAALARTEFRIFLEEWLAKIPEFSISPGSTPQFATGTINSVISLNLSWPTD